MGRVVGLVALVLVCAAACASNASKTGSLVTAQPKPTGLAQLVPGDLDVTADCTASKDPTPKRFVGLIDQLNCIEGQSSSIAGGYLDAYLFESPAALATSFDAINTTYNFFPASAGKNCPPSSATAEGRLSWHESDAVGTLECYSTSDGGHVYIWTNEPDRALFFAKVPRAISFTKLHHWWLQTACCT